MQNLGLRNDIKTDFPSFAWESMHMGLNSASVGMIWKAQNFKVKILCRIYGIANILFTCEKRDFNVQLYLVTIWKNPMSLFGPMWVRLLSRLTRALVKKITAARNIMEYSWRIFWPPTDCKRLFWSPLFPQSYFQITSHGDKWHIILYKDTRYQ